MQAGSKLLRLVMKFIAQSADAHFENAKLVKESRPAAEQNAVHHLIPLSILPSRFAAVKGRVERNHRRRHGELAPPFFKSAAGRRQGFGKVGDDRGSDVHALLGARELAFCAQRHSVIERDGENCVGRFPFVNDAVENAALFVRELSEPIFFDRTADLRRIALFPPKQHGPLPPAPRARHYTRACKPARFLTLCEGARYTAERLPKGIFLEFEPRDQLVQRQKKLERIAELGFDPYPHKFEWKQTPAEIVEKFGNRTAEALQESKTEVSVAGRILTIRLHGKAGFAHIQGEGQRLQIYVKLDAVGARIFELFQLLDMGDIIGASGHLFRTKTNELTVWVEQLTLLTKALLPLPEKWHGLADVEMRYRRRYLDLIANEHVRQVFLRRAQVIRCIRHFFDSRNYLEVETPMMHPILGGATARPFITRHNTFDVDFYMRIAPELYLKRLVVGGMDRVYEINRNFRNEGIDAIHTPEFTMLEFYEAYSDYRDLMTLTEDLFQGIAEKVCGGTKIKYGEHEIDFGRFERLSMREAIVKFWPSGEGNAPTRAELASQQGPRAAAERYNAYVGAKGGDRADSIADLDDSSAGELTGALFEAVAEEHLIQPTFIYDFPVDISPLSKRRSDDPLVAERFELFIEGMELANGFSELNDPSDQEQRFRAQVEAGGVEMPKEVDWDYVRALAHGLPPTAGEGVGIDRLIMLLTNSRSIREVILFPTLRPQKDSETDAAAAPHEENP